ncbi:hypothetical protein SeLEV6574_g01765 [Synchytrium endobioticum]|uniref:Uncharacterized protein n=1 Tax=Synchytrium endobioticum TaxID=286115 RepID=A0A507DC01_9FUNG|nr:hypothetical protein SeLEV6574_g01765 [Synchytrium endobioticum]
MVRPTRHRGQYVFNVLDKSLALRKMRLNADDLVVLAVVSGNDYESNIPDRNFDVAKGVFLSFDEGEVLDLPDRSKELEIRRRVLSRISEVRAAFVANRGNRGNEYLLKAHFTPNPFTPLQSVGEVGRYTYSTIDRTTPMKCPVPQVFKVSPKVVEFDDDKYEEVKEVPEEKAVKPSSKAKAKRAPSGRSSRKIVEKDDSDEETSKKKFTDATRAIASLSQRCGGYRTIHVGHLRGHICIDQKEIIARRINDAVGIVNRARAIAERATEMLIDCICSSNQDTHLLLQLTHGGEGGATYWQNLLRMIIDGNIDARVGPEHLPILEKIEALWGDEFLKNLSWPDSNIKIPMLTVLIKKVAADIDAVFRIHKDAWVIALDPGATCITGAVAFDPNQKFDWSGWSDYIM